ncbi:hypothetical protein ACFQ1I_06650 [Kitasatospora arboriphila]
MYGDEYRPAPERDRGTCETSSPEDLAFAEPGAVLSMLRDLPPHLVDGFHRHRPGRDGIAARPPPPGRRPRPHQGVRRAPARHAVGTGLGRVRAQPGTNMHPSRPAPASAAACHSGPMPSSSAAASSGRPPP